jgi:hypothetical protein
MKTDYREILQRRAAEAKDDLEGSAPMGINQYRAQQAIREWRYKLALYQLRAPEIMASERVDVREFYPQTRTLLNLVRP